MKSIYTLLISLLLATPLLAQTTTHWQPYVRAGVGSSRAIGEQTSSPGGLLLTYPYTSGMVDAIPTKLGGDQWLLVGNAGAGITIPVSSHFGIQAEVNVEQKGSAMAVTGAVYNRGGIMCDPGPCIVTPITGNLSLRLTYLTLPLMVSYRLGKIDLSAGPYVGYKLAERRNGAYSIGNNSYVINTTGNGYGNFDTGFVAGIGYTVTSHIGVDFRYSQGLIYAAKPENRYPYDEYTEPFYNQTAQVGVRYNLLR